MKLKVEDDYFFMKRWNYYHSLPFPGQEGYPVTDNENPGMSVYVKTEEEAKYIVNQLNDYEDNVNHLTDELNNLKETKYLKSDKMVSFEVINIVIERHIEEIRRTLNGLGCNKYDDIDTYYSYMHDIQLLDNVRKEILSEE